MTWAFLFWHIISINDHDIYTKDLEVTLVPELKVLTCLVSVTFVISEVLVYLLNYDMWLLLLWHIHFYKFLNFKVWNFFQPQSRQKSQRKARYFPVLERNIMCCTTYKRLSKLHLKQIHSLDIFVDRRRGWIWWRGIHRWWYDKYHFENVHFSGLDPTHVLLF